MMGSSKELLLFSASGDMGHIMLKTFDNETHLALVEGHSYIPSVLPLVLYYTCSPPLTTSCADQGAAWLLRSLTEYRRGDMLVNFTNLIYGTNLDGRESLQLVPGYQNPQFGWTSTIFGKYYSAK
jgi:hypothetical protein